MTQNQDLGILGSVRAGEQGKPAEHAQYRQVGALTEYQTHYNVARRHQGIAQHVPTQIVTPPVTDLDTARIHRRPVLDGLNNECTQAA